MAIVAFLYLLSLSAIPASSESIQGPTTLDASSYPFTAVESDQSWLNFQSGMRLYEEKRFGEALNAFEKAVTLRKDLFSWAAARLELIQKDKDAKLARGSLSSLMDVLAKRDLIEREYNAIKADAGESLKRRAELLRMRELSDGFAGFLDALTLVYEHRSAASIGDSISSLQSTIDELGFYPEAEYWIGCVYLSEGELRLAELQFRRAYDYRSSFEIPEDRFTVLDALAGVYRASNRWKDYEETLKAIAEASPLFSEKQVFLREAMERTLGRDGFDKFMVLYRVEPGVWTKASADLGSYYLKNGRPQSLIYLAAAANAILARIIEHLRESDFSYSYQTLSGLLDYAEADRDLVRFIHDSELCSTLYQLGNSLAEQGQRESARGIWRSIAQRDSATPWNRLSSDALARSFQ